jgi:type II secretory pathway pseudopilin PulG
MRAHLRSERGITILETTVILSVLFILAGAMSPIVSESVNTARAVKARNDASMIAMGLINFQKDLGGDGANYGGAGLSLQAPRLPALLASQGAAPATDDSNSDSSNLIAPLVGKPEALQMDPARAALRAQRRRWREVAAGALDDVLITNRTGYRYRRPGEYGGWNGPYLSGQVKGDPWGNQYLINSQWLDGGSSTADADGRPRRAVFVVSAGADGVIDTPFEQSVVEARAYGDDIVMRIQ